MIGKFLFSLPSLPLVNSDFFFSTFETFFRATTIDTWRERFYSRGKTLSLPSFFRVYLCTEVERIVTPETSYESLVAMQCAEIEEAMMNEVQRFYIAWNKKLEELKRRNGNQLGAGDSNVMGMGVSGGDMRSM